MAKNWLADRAADVIGAVDALTPGRAGQTLNRQLRSPYVNYKGAINPEYAPKTIEVESSGLNDVIEVPSSGTGGSRGGGGGVVDRDAAMRNTLKSRIAGRGNEIEAIYNLLFGDLDALLKARDSELEEQYGDQLEKATAQYVDALPTIENSYAAIGSADSTDNTDAKSKAKKGFDETTETIGKNKAKDKAALGQYGNEQRAKFSADKESAQRAIQSSSETTDVDALRGLDNDLSGNISQAGVTRATLGTDGSARQAITSLTGDAGRFEAATNALDQIIKSSMSGAVKEAAVKAVTDAGGLSEDEKRRVQQTYGNVYAEQAAL